VTTLRNLVSKATVQAALAVGVVGVASYLAIVKQIDGPTYFGLAVIVVGFYFRAPSPEPPAK